jgi:putative endonuclease
MNARANLGDGGETAAAELLKDRGYRILERNFRCKAGEIDIIATSGDTIVFCEVKTRTTDRWGQPSEAVDRRKQARLRRLGAIWLSERRASARLIRFDVISVVMQGEQPRLEHIPDAF